MTNDQRVKRCGAKHAIGLMCDREVGHTGPHRGYDDVIDEPLFWARLTANPPGVTGIPVRGSRGAPRLSSRR